MARNIIKLDPQNKEYLAQVKRYHNNVDWCKGEKKPVISQTSISLDEMQERWNAYDWLIADEKHFEAKCIRHADEALYKERQEKREREKLEAERIEKDARYYKPLGLKKLRKHMY